MRWIAIGLTSFAFVAAGLAAVLAYPYLEQVVGTGSEARTVNKMQEAYTEHLRSSLFNAFLTLGGFLFSVKTFIVVRLNEDLYSKEPYQANVRKKRKGKIGEKLTYYGPLKRITALLVASVALCIVASISQFSLGMYANRWTIAICLALASAAIAVLLVTLYVVWAALSDYFDKLEKFARDREKAQEGELQTEKPEEGELEVEGEPTPDA